MGYWKNRMIEQQEQGWDFLDEDVHVCAECFDDEAIKQFIESNAEEKECFYCQASSEKAIAASMNEVLTIIGSAVKSEYTDPANELPREDGDWVFGGSIMYIDEVLEQLGWPTQNDEVAEAIREAFRGQSYVKRHFFSLSETEQLRFGWSDFVDAVKHRTRYLFTLPAKDDTELNHDEIPPHKMLDEIGAVIRNVGLVQEMKAGTKWFRVRIHNPAESFSTTSELGTVQREKAIYPNRMSPAGIPMFYGAADEPTAIAETYTPKKGQKAVATVATFETARDILVLDLTSPPPIPSPYDEDSRHLRHVIAFLKDFISELTHAIEKDGREHIEYVPTQIVTEYFRHVFRTPTAKSVKGILYRSSKNGNGVCCVLFFENENCCAAGTGWQLDENNCLGLTEVFRKNL